VEDPVLGLVEPQTVALGPSIQSVQIPLQSLPTLQQVDTPNQLGVICKLTLSIPSSGSLIKILIKTGPKTEL